ncbi:hypothetical protein D9758_009822 [Tetrapyrgos nigripes]|uniref:Cytochrome P450 n=1 Tax=Tetrapyrgos nigripes TaxID=182062 RepID=A0A8H5GNA2_9AGAR|nr:hypothetical protein D9758_009822 [Tetrapyrgos nigripes]
MKTVSELLESSSFTSATVLAVLAVVASTILRRARSSRLPYPPGPTGYWLVGLLNIPLKKNWQHYVELGKIYGDLIHYTRFGKHYLVVNSVEAANDILEKQARISSDRPHTPLDKLAAWGTVLYVSPKYHQIEIQQVQRFMTEITSANPGVLLDQIATAINPISPWADCYSLSQKIMFNTLYDLDLASSKEDMPRHAREVLDSNDLLFVPGWDAIKYIPFIHRFPSWFPGGHLKVLHKQIAQVLGELGAAPFNATLGLMKSNEKHSSIVGDLVISAREREDYAEELVRIQNMGLQSVIGASISNRIRSFEDSLLIQRHFYDIAAADTTMSAIATFFLAMSLYPDVQRKAQQELDSVLGPGKLPTFADRDFLPYIEAIYREVMRWHPAIPMGLPHETTAPIIYRGYYIPEGTAIYGNIWAMNRNSSVWQNPDEFIPERHLRQDGQFDHISSILAYGFGRRICVGRWMANDTLFISIAIILATPQTDLTRLVKWPEHVRLQRQKVILNQRLKVPPSIAQFSHTLDKNTATQLFKLLNKYRPETKTEKKERLTATAEGNGKKLPSTPLFLSHVHVRAPPETSEGWVPDARLTLKCTKSLVCIV